MKYFILAGEKSGDLHGANLIRALHQQDKTAKILAWGGDEMQAAGGDLLIHHKDIAIMGLIGVLQNITRLKRLFKTFEVQINDFKPDTIIFIDYGGFNLKAAKIAKLAGFHTQFYIAPKVWAWNYSRVKTIRKWIDELYVIFPFEQKLFEDEGISTHYVGNPIMDELSAFKVDKNFLAENHISKPFIALLPGSRKQELTYLLPVFKQLKETLPQYNFIIGGVKEFKNLIEKTGIQAVYDNTYSLLTASQIAIVCSGTATLETALLGTPLVVVYKTDNLFYNLAKLLVKLKYISLVNIILDKLAIPELLQNEVNVSKISQHIESLFPENSIERINQLEDFKTLKKLVGEKGASDRAAQIIIEKAKNFSNNS
ncbi:lipid-A-disaccharide synthase [Sandaracinomonas limnophila]|uniref:Lipid-A-disaccharide synthase n=1 Tax=Sandaracinomonas limnophila TaxID=1862386 RepID=A0A437PWX2_9BACT|nr:lipid-A-disaccharide synthase [Sandaracinomonas limnophila]RVU26767.1 lipid-A-disaccharide synthase [Sandaracinomonas limnophila]